MNYTPIQYTAWKIAKPSKKKRQENENNQHKSYNAAYFLRVTVKITKRKRNEPVNCYFSLIFKMEEINPFREPHFLNFFFLLDRTWRRKRGRWRKCNSVIGVMTFGCLNFQKASSYLVHSAKGKNWKPRQVSCVFFLFLSNPYTQFFRKYRRSFLFRFFNWDSVICFKM